MSMPLIAMKEIATPLKLIGIRLFKASDGGVYIKLGKRPRRRLFG